MSAVIIESFHLEKNIYISIREFVLEVSLNGWIKWESRWIFVVKFEFSFEICWWEKYFGDGIIDFYRTLNEWYIVCGWMNVHNEHTEYT